MLNPFSFSTIWIWRICSSVKFTSATLGAAAAVQCRPARRPHRYGRDDLAPAVDDDDLVTHHEVLVSAPLRIDFDERGGHIDNPHARRYRGSDAQREVDVVHARYVPAGKDGLLNARALLRVERHAATGSLRTLLRLTLLRLALLRNLL